MRLEPNKIYRLRNGAVIKTGGESHQWIGQQFTINFQFLKPPDGQFYAGYRGAIVVNPQDDYAAIKEIEP